MNEKGNIYIPRIWLIIIVIAIVTMAIVGILIGISKVDENTRKQAEAKENIIDNAFEEKQKKVDYSYLDEGIAKHDMPKVELNTIAEQNSTIDGKAPSFYNPVIPKGFKAIGNVQDATIDENAKWGELKSYLYGLVIEDEKQNQFVWVPVENMEVFKTTDWEKNSSTGSLSETYLEPAEDEEEEYNKMYYKVKKYGGFYVGRFETGDMTAASERTTAKNSDLIGIRKQLNTYNYLPYSLSTVDQREVIGAQELAINYSKQNGYKTIVSSVIYGVQWDAMLKFIKSEEINVTSSVNWGNYVTSEFNYTDINGNSFIKRVDEVRLLKAGASEQTKAKNIYDIAGNLYEWTKETAGAGKRVVRGGCYVVNIGQLASSRYAYDENTANNAIGFRISFYVN